MMAAASCCTVATSSVFNCRLGILSTPAAAAAAAPADGCEWEGEVAEAEECEVEPELEGIEDIPPVDESMEDAEGPDRKDDEDEEEETTEQGVEMLCPLPKLEELLC